MKTTQTLEERVREMSKPHIVQDVDGYYYYWPKPNGGHYDSYQLRIIADILDEMNKDLDDESRPYWYP